MAIFPEPKAVSPNTSQAHGVILDTVAGMGLSVSYLRHSIETAAGFSPAHRGNKTRNLEYVVPDVLAQGAESRCLSVICGLATPG